MAESSLVVITIKCRDQVFQVDIPEDQTVQELKRRLELYVDILAGRQRIVHNGRILRDSETVQNFHDETLWVVRLSDNGVADTESPMESNVENQSQKWLKSMAQSPLFKGMFSDGNLLRSIVASNPQMKKVLEKNPELDHIVNNPAIMKEALEAMNNPSYQKELIRNNDRALSNIELHPEGFNALRRAYSTVQEPMLQALNDPAQPAIVEQETADLPNKLNKEPLPNAWARNKPTDGQPNNPNSSGDELKGNGNQL